MLNKFVTNVRLRKSINRTKYWHSGNSEVHRDGIHLGFFSGHFENGLKAGRAASYLRGEFAQDEYATEIIVSPEKGIELFERLGEDLEDRYEAIVRIAYRAMATLLSRENLNAPCARWIAAWQSTKERAWLIIMLAQSVLDFEEARKIHRFPKELFQIVNSGETAITEIFRSAFDYELEIQK